MRDISKRAELYLDNWYNIPSHLRPPIPLEIIKEIADNQNPTFMEFVKSLDIYPLEQLEDILALFEADIVDGNIPTDWLECATKEECYNYYSDLLDYYSWFLAEEELEAGI